MASAKDFPDLIREGDPLLGNSYRHYYGGSYYHLLFPDWPEGCRRDVQAAVYLENREKGEHRRVGSAALSESISRCASSRKSGSARSSSLPRMSAAAFSYALNALSSFFRNAWSRSVAR